MYKKYRYRSAERWKGFAILEEIYTFTNGIFIPIGMK
jgi:hypothetical protein